jgi:hypothetical protein
MFGHQCSIWGAIISQNPHTLDTIPLTASSKSQLTHQPELLLAGLRAIRWPDPDH